MTARSAALRPGRTAAGCYLVIRKALNGADAWVVRHRCCDVPGHVLATTLAEMHRRHKVVLCPYHDDAPPPAGLCPVCCGLPHRREKPHCRRCQQPHSGVA